MTKNTVDIIVLTYNRLQYFSTFVKELSRRTRYPFRLIVVDNGSVDGTRAVIEQMQKDGIVWKYLFTDDNYLMAKAFTMGFSMVESEYFITVADDMILPKLDKKTPCWLEVFVAKMDSDKDIGCINFVGARRAYSRFIEDSYE